MVSVTNPPIYFDVTLDKVSSDDVPKTAFEFSGVTVTDYSVSKVSDLIYRLNISSITGTGRLSVSIKESVNEAMYFEPKGSSNTSYVDVVSSGTGVQNLKNITSIDGAFNNTCYVSAGEVYCSGVKGLPSFHYHVTPFYPKRIAEWSGAKKVCSGDYSTCVWKNDGSVSCGGEDPDVMGGSLSSDDVPASTAITNAVDYDCGQMHSCAVVSDGIGDEAEVYCWGANTSGEIGQGVTGSFYATATQIAGLKDVKSIKAGHGHTCIIKSDDSLACWGYNNAGQTGQIAGAALNTPTDVPGLSNIQSIQLGRYNSCALDSADTLYCWGQNNRGQLGDGTTTSTHLPVSFMTNVTDYVIGYEFICAMNNANEVFCAGINAYNRLPISGLVKDDTVTTPTKLVLPQVPKKIFASRESFCITYGVDDEALCWGESRYGQFGNGFATLITSPTEVTALTSPVDVSSGYNYSCSITNTNTVSCYGDTWFYKLGNNVYASLDYNYHTPADILTPVANPVEVGTGSNHTCARDNTGQLYCWGPRVLLGINNASGVANTPQAVSGASNVDQLSVAGNSTCYINTLDRVYCFGYGVYGQLCQGATDENNSLVPVQVSITGTPSKISSAHSNHCVLAGGSVYCWGANQNKQLGNLGISDSFYGSPLSVFLPGLATDISVGYHHACAVVSGEVYCWGEAEFAQLGSTQSTGDHVSTKVVGLSGITQVFSGYRHNCALNGSNELYCWGDNHAGQIGNGEVGAPVSTPYKVSIPGTISKVSLGRSHSCVIATGKQYCWGDHSEGQLGLGEKDYMTPFTGSVVQYSSDYTEFPR